MLTKNSKIPGLRNTSFKAPALICGHFKPDHWEALCYLPDKNDSISRKYFHVFTYSLIYTEDFHANFIK